MTDGVKQPRPYVSRVRAQGARERRRAVLASAHELLVADGYAAATLPRIAARAGVSVELVHKSFGDKALLVRELVDVALGGDDAPVAVRDRPQVREMMAEPRGSEVLGMYARFAADTNARAAPLLLALAGAASADPRLIPVWSLVQEQRLAGAAALISDVAGKATLIVSAEVARDLVWAATSPELYRLLVLDRGWPLERYAEHLASSWRSSLLDER